MSKYTPHKNAYPKSATTTPFSTISSIPCIMGRIKNADSPISVFKHRKGKGLVAVFANTIETAKIAIPSNRDFVGTFDGTESADDVRLALNSAYK